MALDSDNENSTLKRFHPEAGFLNLANPRGLDPMIQSLNESNLVVVDCRAASTDLFLDFFTSTDLSDLLAGLDAGLTLAMPVGAELDSIEQIQRLIQELADRCQYVVIRNAVHNDTFALFEASKVRHGLKTELGAKEISMSRMQNWLVDGLNRNNLTPTTARNSPEFYLLDRQRLIMCSVGSMNKSTQ